MMLSNKLIISHNLKVMTNITTQKSGVSKKGCWQRNWKILDYIPILRRYFTEVSCQGKLIVCQAVC
ncbi:hypothetical protein [Candidatus Marithrix sp. Canyon 246]|uniref:hypothetical protein n=2 Tax=Candidatus Marithrix sp. Canyon 246 TaxID=1827136 RepID=UPI001C0B1D91|nr:hypothetical protein [Candidatus Marithrix sp. Canyon 246]